MLIARVLFMTVLIYDCAVHGANYDGVVHDDGDCSPPIVSEDINSLHLFVGLFILPIILSLIFFFSVYLIFCRNVDWK